LKEKIRALIVDDSAFMRKSLSIMLSSDEDIEVVDTAKDGLDGLEKAKALKPDIITLDVEMPRMDGLTALKRIMAEAPTSVIMVSSITTEGAESTLTALELGAADFISKETSFVSVNIIKIKEDLINKIKAITKQSMLKQRLARIKGTASAETKPPPFTRVRALPNFGYNSIALGISTGGPLSLQKVIPALSESINIPIFIVQHMPPKFTKSLADRLNGMSKLKVKEAEDKEVVSNGTVYIAPGGFHMKIKKGSPGSSVINISETPDSTLHRPSVDIMMDSVIELYGKKTLGVIMTGMGKDGINAISKLKSLGGYCLAQDEASCVVYGMPKAVVEAGYADVVAPLDKIANIINKAC